MKMLMSVRSEGGIVDTALIFYHLNVLLRHQQQLRRRQVNATNNTLATSCFVIRSLSSRDLVTPNLQQLLLRGTNKAIWTKE